MNKRQMIAGALTASLMVSALPGLAFAQDSESEVTPEAVEWTLSTLAGETVPMEVETTLFLSGGEVVGNAGCNSYFGSYELDGEMLTFPAPFGVTQMFCEGPEMDVESAYLSLLETTATWSIDDEGALSLADADGAVQLIYGEAPIEVTATDIDALVATLGGLQGQIDEATAVVTALAAETAAIPVNKFDKRVTTVEKSVTQLEKKTKGLNVENLKKRISALEATVERLDKTIDRFRDRLLVLEDAAKDHEKRIKALEGQAANLPA
jgi:heat shock protein HslJ